MKIGSETIRGHCRVLSCPTPAARVYSGTGYTVIFSRVVAGVAREDPAGEEMTQQVTRNERPKADAATKTRAAPTAELAKDAR
jgi:hypothetical protein